MLKNNKGFSLVELFAMILITTVLIIPLIQSLVNNIQVNDALQQRRSATSISSSSLGSISKMDFLDIDSLLDNEINVNSDYFYDLNYDSCTDLDANEDILLCQSLFSTVWNNLELSSTEYKVIIYNFYLDDTAYTDLINDPNIPIAVRNKIEDDFQAYHPATLTTDEINTNITLLRATVWVEYYNDPISTLILSGVIFDD